MSATELGTALRAWRARLPPTVRRGAGRHTTGLRREEVAAKAGISVNYLVRLEQGRAAHPSGSVVASLAEALELSTTETAYLSDLAGDGPTRRAAQRQITPSVHRILQRLGGVPMIVIDPAWTIVQANAAARRMLGNDLVGDNSARRQFLGPHFVTRDAEQADSYERDIVGDLRRQLARHRDDPALTQLISELRAGSARFAQLWADPAPRDPHASRKTFTHPDAGTITVDCDYFDIVGSDLRVVVWTAEPGTPDEDALTSLIG